MSKKNLSIFPEGNPFIQTKLKIGKPNDTYEQETDRVADQVMRTSEHPECEENKIQTKPIGDQITPLIQRYVEPEEEEEEQEGEDVPEEDEEAAEAESENFNDEMKKSARQNLWIATLSSGIIRKTKRRKKRKRTRIKLNLCRPRHHPAKHQL
jgi:hypothetical protein